MQRHWEGAFVVRDEMDKRFRELSSVAMLARRDIDRHIWLSQYRPKLAASAPVPPGVEAKTLRKETKKKRADGAKANSRKTYYSCQEIDDMSHSSGSELRVLLRLFSTLVLLTLCVKFRLKCISLYQTLSIQHISRHVTSCIAVLWGTWIICTVMNWIWDFSGTSCTLHEIPNEVLLSVRNHKYSES